MEGPNAATNRANRPYCGSAQEGNWRRKERGNVLCVNIGERVCSEWETRGRKRSVV